MLVREFRDDVTTDIPAAVDKHRYAHHGRSTMLLRLQSSLVRTSSKCVKAELTGTAVIDSTDTARLALAREELHKLCADEVCRVDGTRAVD